MSVIVRASEIAQMFGRKTGWFYAHREKLEKDGFPKRNDLLGGWSRPAVERWVARQVGIRAPSPQTAKDRLRGAINAHADALRNAAD